MFFLKSTKPEQLNAAVSNTMAAMMLCYSLLPILLQPSTAVVSFRHTTDVFLITPCCHVIDIWFSPQTVPLLYRAKEDFYLINVHFWDHLKIFIKLLFKKTRYSYKELSLFDFLVDIRNPNKLIHRYSWVSIFVVIVN